MNREYPSITVGELREALALWNDEDLICFSGLTFARVTGRGERFAQVEFNELVYLDEAGRAVVQSLE